MTAELVMDGGTVLTMDPERPRAEALAVAGGRIAAVGTEDEVAGLWGPRTVHVDLAGRTVLPGFNDAHVHIWKVGQILTTVIDLRGAPSLGAVYGAVRARAAAAPAGTWIVGRGWNEAVLAEGTGPDRSSLDQAAPDHPVVLTRTCAHIHAANTAALHKAGIAASTTPPGGGRLDFEKGLLYETAFGLLQRAMPAPRAADYERWILAGARHLLGLGVTSATDAGVDPVAYGAYRSLEDAGRLPLRVNLLHLFQPDLGGAPYALPPPVAYPRLRCDTVKLFADGALSGGTAALSLPYRGEGGGQGLLRCETEDLHRLARQARLSGFRLAIHAIGDRALDQVLEVYTRLARSEPEGPAHRVEHFGVPSPAHLQAARELRVHVVTQPAFLRELGVSFRRWLPETLLGRCYAVGAMARAGVSLAFSSDGPVVRDLSPLSGVAAAATATFDPGDALPVTEGLSAYTAGGAAAQGDRANRGLLREGQWADMVVLDRDPLSVPPEELPGVAVSEVYVGGHLVRGES